MLDKSHPLNHYIGLVMVIVALYFCVVKPGVAWLDKQHQTGPNTTIVSREPAPSGTAAKVAGMAADLAKDRAFIAALQGEILQLSAGQRTVASVVGSIAGGAPSFHAGLTEGLTRPHPARQVVEVGTKVSMTPPPPALTDDQIQRDLKSVLKDTTTKVDTSVTVKWEERPFSPIFAAYAANGDSGLGINLRHTKALDLDALVLKGGQGALVPGLGLSHDIKGTSAGLGIGILVNKGKIDPSIYAKVRF